SVLRKWAGPDSRASLAVSLEALRRFRVLVPVAAAPVSGGSPAQPQLGQLSRNFQLQLSAFLLGTGACADSCPPDSAEPSTAAPFAEDLHRHAVARWDAVLEHLLLAAGSKFGEFAEKSPSTE
ncbi:unnamed protein product, partial [Polarella glacialis]